MAPGGTCQLIEQRVGVVAADCTRTYTVKEGDYCDKISRENQVST